ncbi:DUF2339 domain-containing protein [Pedobacter namyangjuensis]|uniref:DUF2339 domain-containing protein n=1 Tax=Pedobacter namyangjuensis TaxID=600626 RepID=UPI000DE1F13A|nr:DUF2339 domain-containing protein [Pedobacter namyangjuensis]
MENDKEKLNTLLLKLENLSLRQQNFEAEINSLKQEIIALKGGSPIVNELVKEAELPPVHVPPFATVFPPKNTPPTFTAPPIKPSQPSFADKFNRANMGKSDFEKFIGENLISKIGILILIIGVIIGAKYAIDKELLSPLTRIILGYLVGVGLTGFALKLKAKYESFSAVLLSGAMAIMYFITYAAYDFYALLTQPLAFLLMVVFTCFTVFAAVKYDKPVIAHIGLVGAYAVPFLLSDGSGKVAVLFSYMTIINIGILVLSFKKHWKSLFYLSFSFTWIIFCSWLAADYETKNFTLAFGFSSIFFAIFYGCNLAYKLRKAELFGISDVIILLLNSFVFYGIGYFLLAEHKNGAELLGLFTLANAIIHFVVCLFIYRLKLADKNLFYFILAMVITFITLAIPVQLSGNWVTIFWAMEATILFYLGKSKNISIYQKLSFPLIFLAFLSLLEDWSHNNSEFNYLGDYSITKPFINVQFLCGVIFIGCFTAMLFINKKSKSETLSNGINKVITDILTYTIPSILIIVTYFTFRTEIGNIFRNLFEGTKINTGSKGNTYYEYNVDYKNLKTIAVFIYSMFFASALTLLNIKKIKSKELAVANASINTVTILAFLVQGLFILSELRHSFIHQVNKYFISGSINIGVRYIAIAFFGLLIYSCYKLAKADIFKVKFKKAFDYLLYIAILWVLSSELLHWLEIAGLQSGYKLGLSILWGVYSLVLIGIGLWKNKKFLRIGAIVLFAITLLKLFLYDIASLDTISKTIVFVSLGVLLLLISFLYNKYKHLIIDDVKTEN